MTVPLLFFSFFLKEYLKPQVQINQMDNSVIKHPLIFL